MAARGVTRGTDGPVGGLTVIFTDVTVFLVSAHLLFMQGQFEFECCISFPHHLAILSITDTGLQASPLKGKSTNFAH